MDDRAFCDLRKQLFPALTLATHRGGGSKQTSVWGRYLSLGARLSPAAARRNVNGSGDLCDSPKQILRLAGIAGTGHRPDLACQGHQCIESKCDGLRSDGNKSDPTGQSGLAGVKGAKFRRANQLRGGDVQHIQRAATNGWRVIRGDGFRLAKNTMPQAAFDNQQPGGNIVFHFLPGGLNFNRRQRF